MIKEISKSLSQINDKKYDGCFMAKVNLEIVERCDEIKKYKVNIEKSNSKFSLIRSNGYLNDKAMINLSIYLINGTSKKINVSKKNKVEEYKNFLTHTIKFTKEEVYNFSKYTRDINSIHLENKPVVQGLLILMYLEKYLKDVKSMEVKFINPMYAESLVHICELENIIIGYIENKLCFKAKFEKNNN